MIVTKPVPNFSKTKLVPLLQHLKIRFELDFLHQMFFRHVGYGPKQNLPDKTQQQ
jgi:hypothetical protein